MAPVAFLALLLIAPASLQSAEPWGDHLGEMRIGIPGSSHSRGMFQISPNYDFVHLELMVVAKRTRVLKEYRVSANSIKRDKATGYWGIKLPAGLRGS
jgi:hypothetical protein